jgi:hypothetical protein
LNYIVWVSCERGEDFSFPSKVKELVNEAVAKGIHSGDPDNYTIRYAFGYDIGTTRKAYYWTFLQIA